MKVLIVIVTALILGTRAWNQTQLFPQALNRSDWSGWESQFLNSNRSEVGNNFNKSEWLAQALNRNNSQSQNVSQWQNQALLDALKQDTNRNQWRLDSLNNSRLQALNKTQWQLQALNNSEVSNDRRQNFGRFNRSQWINRTKRSDPGLKSPAAYYNNPWNQTTANGDVIIGQIGFLDRLLFNQTYLKESRWWSGREKIVEYPKDLPGKNNWNRHENITAIRIYNKFYDGLESSAKILSGGVGYRYVKIKLSSPWNRGFHYLVQIFGK